MSEPASEKADLVAILAGGAGARMGGLDKGEVMLGGRPLFRFAADRLAPQARSIAVIAPQAPRWLSQIAGARWLADAPDSKGPAAGLLAALRRLREEQGEDALLLTAPIDAPFLPADLFEKLDAARRKAVAPAAIVRHAGGWHPVFGLWRAACAGPVAEAAKTERALHRIATCIGAASCEAWAGAAQDPFANLNTSEDVAAAETVLRFKRS